MQQSASVLYILNKVWQPLVQIVIAPTTWSRGFNLLDVIQNVVKNLLY